MSNSDLRTLWVGDIEAWMHEQFIESVFNKVGKVISVKLIRTKETSLPAGYCFVEFQTHEQAERILMNYNQQLIPGTQNTFRMNWGKNPTNTGIIKQPATTQANNGYMNNSYGAMQQPVIQMTPIQEFSIYVGELELGVNEQQLSDHFRTKYSSVIGSKIITEPTSKMSKGYGFVKFSNPIEGQRAIHEMNGSLFKGKFIKVSQAVSRQQQQAAGGTPGFPQAAGYGAPTVGVDNPYSGYSQYYTPQQSSTDPYYGYGGQYGYGNTSYSSQQYPYPYSSSYYSNGAAYGTDPYGQTAQTGVYGQQATSAVSSQATQGQASQYQQQYYSQYSQQGSVPQVAATSAASSATAAQQQQYYNQTPAASVSQSSQQSASSHDKYSQNNYQSQQSSNNTHYSQQQQYSHQHQSQNQQQSQTTQGQAAQSSHQNHQQYNSSEKKQDSNSIPTPSAKETSLFQKPSSDFIGYQPEYVSMTGELEFILKHNIC